MAEPQRNYERVNWDTTKYVNPSNMNHMDEGIYLAQQDINANKATIASILGRMTGYNALDNILSKGAQPLGSAFDYNTIEPGVYYLTGPSPMYADNKPPYDYPTNCYFIYYKEKDADRGFQLILPGNNEYAYYRSKVTDSTNWREWKTLGQKIKSTEFNISLDVSANSNYTTDITYGDIPTRNIISTNIWWSNSLNDTPLSVLYYGSPTNYMVHRWSVSQRVNITYRVVYFE